jgi:hypothetical protein
MIKKFLKWLAKILCTPSEPRFEMVDNIVYYPPFTPGTLLIGRCHHMDKEKKAMVITRGNLKERGSTPLWHESIWSILRPLIDEGG